MTSSPTMVGSPCPHCGHVWERGHVCEFIKLAERMGSSASAEICTSKAGPAKAVLNAGGRPGQGAQEGGAMSDLTLDQKAILALTATIEQLEAQLAEATAAWHDRDTRLLATEAQLAEAERNADQLLKERDHAEGMADKLADALATMLCVDIGEHSSGNCPWTEALEAFEERATDRASVEGEK